MRKTLLFLLLISSFSYLKSQNKELTLEDIWLKNKFIQRGVYGLSSMSDGLNYTTLEANEQAIEIVKYEYKTGKKVSTILSTNELNNTITDIETYQFSADEKKILIATESEPLYRHSSKEHYYVWDLTTKKLLKVTNGDKQMYATFSPDGNNVAFVRNNNLFVKNLTTNTETAITTDGKLNNIINGATDWVYEEEFAFSQAYFWSPDGNYIAFYKFDESKVKEFEMNEYNAALYPSVYKFKYPKAGEENSNVSIHIYNIKTQQTLKVAETGINNIEYIPRIKWTADASTLSIIQMNRLQNNLDILLADATNGKTKNILNEKSDTYIDINDDLTFLNDKKSFIWSSDKDGYQHLYLYDLQGKQIKQITKGNWDVTEYKGFDEASKTIFYISTESSATERDLYSIKIDGTSKKKLATQKGTNSADFSTSYKYYINTHSDANQPSLITLHEATGKQIRILEDNSDLKKITADYQLSKKEFFSFKTSENVELNGWMMKPLNFDANKKHPVFMTFYGGPGHNEVNNAWTGAAYLWHNYLCTKGYIVVCVDNRGTEGRGRDFKKCTYKQLGKLEIIDQIETAKYLATLSFVDKARIGVQGWSFGGYLTSLCMTKGADYFKMGIAVAPVTNWRFYDNIYTERFLATPQENPKGYDENSPINFTDKLKGKYLLIHGSSDDNVHLQNSMEMSRALIKSNKQFEQFIYPDKNHSIKGGNTRFHLYTKMTNFILENL